MTRDTGWWSFIYSTFRLPFPLCDLSSVWSSVWLSSMSSPSSTTCPRRAVFSSCPVTPASTACVRDARCEGGEVRGTTTLINALVPNPRATADSHQLCARVTSYGRRCERTTDRARIASLAGYGTIRRSCPTSTPISPPTPSRRWSRACAPTSPTRPPGRRGSPSRRARRGRARERGRALSG